MNGPGFHGDVASRVLWGSKVPAIRKIRLDHDSPVPLERLDATSHRRPRRLERDSDLAGEQLPAAGEQIHHLSLDGFYTGPDPSADQGLGAGGRVLHAWLQGRTANREQLSSHELVKEMLDTCGAMIAGRDGYDHAQAARVPSPRSACRCSC